MRLRPLCPPAMSSAWLRLSHGAAKAQGLVRGATSSISTLPWGVWKGTGNSVSATMNGVTIAVQSSSDVNVIDPRRAEQWARIAGPLQPLLKPVPNCRCENADRLLPAFRCQFIRIRHCATTTSSSDWQWAMGRARILLCVHISMSERRMLLWPLPQLPYSATSNRSQGSRNAVAISIFPALQSLLSSHIMPHNAIASVPFQQTLSQSRNDRRIQFTFQRHPSTMAREHYEAAQAQKQPTSLSRSCTDRLPL